MDEESTQSSNEPVDAGTTDAVSTPAETTPEVADSTPVQKDNGELIHPTEPVDEPEASEETETPAEDPKQEEQPQDIEPPQDISPKSENRFQQLANERNQLRQELEQYRAREAQLATEQELLNEVNPETGEYYTPAEVERLAFQQSREQQAQDVATQRYELEVKDAQFQLRDEATRALSDFPMFDENSPSYDKDLAASADELLGANIVVETDGEGKPTGRIIGSNISPYKIYQTVAKAAEKSRIAGQINGQRATEKMLASVDGTGSNQQGDTSFDKLSVSEMAARLRKAGHDV